MRLLIINSWHGLKEYSEDIINLIFTTEHPFLRLVLINGDILSALYKMLSRLKKIAFRNDIRLNIPSIITLYGNTIYCHYYKITTKHEFREIIVIFLVDFCRMFDVLTDGTSFRLFFFRYNDLDEGPDTRDKDRSLPRAHVS